MTRTVQQTNWAGNVTFGATAIHRPESIDALRKIVANSRHARALGTGHSFNAIADTDGDLISVADLPRVFSLDPTAAAVTISPGLRYGDVAVALHSQGYALANLGSLPHISVAGACATGTHGSGVANRGLASAVRALDVVTADGSLVTLRRDADDEFAGAVVALGALGVVTSMTLDVVPAFDVEQYVYDSVPGTQVAEHFDEIAGAAYSVSLFTDWRSRDIGQVWIKHKVDHAHPWTNEPSWHGGVLAREARHPLPGMPATYCTQQLGVAGPAHERLPHFRLDFVPSNGDELQAEFLLPVEHAADAIDAISAIAQDVAPVLHISEIRTIAADDLWLSPSYGRDSVAFHFTLIKDEGRVAPVVDLIGRRLAPFAARPHWGKLFGHSAEALRPLYPRYDDFAALRRRYDPDGKFRNPFIARLFPE
jgi:xylitol oxidase